MGRQTAGKHPAPLFTSTSEGNSVFAKQSGFIFGEGEVVLIGMKGINWTKRANPAYRDCTDKYPQGHRWGRTQTLPSTVRVYYGIGCWDNGNS